MNVTNEIKNYFPDQYVEGINFFRFGINDTNDDDIEKHLDNALSVFRNNKDKNIFVHCYMGLSRSVSCIIYYLMMDYNMTFDEAIQFVQAKRPAINLNTTFEDVLRGKEQLSKEIQTQEINTDQNLPVPYNTHDIAYEYIKYPDL